MGDTSSVINVAMCVDHGFTLPLAVALASIDQVSAEDSVIVHVIHPGFAHATQRRVTSGLSNIEVRWCTLDEHVFKGVNYTASLSPATLYRLLLDRLLPSTMPRVLYLDADIVARTSLASVYATDLNGTAVGAVRDADSPWAASSHGRPWRTLGLSPSSAYFNAGVLLIDFPRWRADAIGVRGIEFLRKHNPRWGDQDTLNVLLEGKWFELPRRWNLQTGDLGDRSVAWAHWPQDIEDALQNPGIIHFTDSDKPWNSGSSHPMTDLWFETLDTTAWSGWRPKPPPQYTLARRAVGAARSIRDRVARQRAALPQ